VTDLEKLTINISPLDIGQIEILVEQGFYANRAEFVRTAIRDELAKHSETVRETAKRKTFIIGAMVIGRAELERRQKRGEQLDLRVIGLLGIEENVPASLARAVIESVEVRGIFRASKDVKDALADRIRG